MPYHPFDWSPPSRPGRAFVDFYPASWTPPQSSSNRVASSDASALWDEAEEVRGRLGVKPKASKSHGYKHPALAQKVAAWAPDVVVSLAVSEVMTILRFEAGANDFAPARLKVVDVASTQHMVCELTPPANTSFIETHSLGLPSVIGKKGHRKASRNAILSHAANLDLMYMEGLGLGIEQNRHAYLLMLATLSLLHASGQLFKHQFSVPRPHLLAQGVQPTLQVPGHASYPAGHAAQARAVSNLFADLLSLPPPGGGKTLRDRLIDVADRIADMRVVAGLHYEFDCLAGKALGQSVASLLNLLGGRAATAWEPHTYVAGDASPTKAAPTSATLPATPVLTFLWAQAAKELADANID